MQISDFYVDTFIRLNATCIGTRTLSDAYPLTFDGKEYAFERLSAYALHMFCKSQFLSIRLPFPHYVVWCHGDKIPTERTKEQCELVVDFCDNQRVCMCAFWQCKIWYQHSHKRVLLQPFYKIWNGGDLKRS